MTTIHDQAEKASGAATLSTAQSKSRLRLAYFSPLPPARSGIADYSRELLPYLARHTDIILYTKEPQHVEGELRAQFPIHPLRQYPVERQNYDIALYQMGNSAHHESLYQMFLRYPGIVTLHDYSLHQFIAHRTSGNKNSAGYVRELGYALGNEGVNLAWHPARGDFPQPLHALPLNGRLLDLSLGVIVHSRYAQELILTRNSALPTAVVPHQMEELFGNSRRRELPWPDDAVIFASIGQVTAAKQIEFALHAFKQALPAIPNARYLIVGEQTLGVDLPAIIQSLDLADYVWQTGHEADWQTFIDWFYTADIIVNLRYPTIGETSGTALRALATGRPLIVFDHGWYSEIPDSACVKIASLDETGLTTAMIELSQKSAERRRLGQRGRQYIQQECHPAQIAEAYSAFIHRRINAIKEIYR